MAGKPKKRSAGGGRTANTEPRLQVFRQFGGCNFQLSPRDFDYSFNHEAYDEHPTQTDLMMNQVVVQNNARITPTFTIETRQNLKTLFDAPAGRKFTGVATLIGSRIFAATVTDPAGDVTSLTNNRIYHANIGDATKGVFTEYVAATDLDGTLRDNTWTYLGYADDKLVGMTKGKQIWTGALSDYTGEDPFTLTNAKEVDTPTALTFASLTKKGSLEISAAITPTCPFRISIRHTYLNKYGPTLPSAALTFYASKPTTEWSTAAYVQISSTAPTGYAIEAVELYYTEGDYQTAAFLGRVNFSGQDGGAWSYNWTGYLFDPSMLAVANLSLPTQNYTSGVPASRMEVIDGQLYFWGGTPGYRVWIGGNPGNRFSVSTGTGGGFVDCDPGRGNVVREVLKYKTQQGAAIVTMLADNENSQQEHRFNLIETNISLSNEQPIKGWSAEKVAGAVGCKSYYGAKVAGDGLYAVSRYGLAITTLTMEYNSQIKIEYISDAIEPVFLQQYGNQLDKAVLFTVNDIIYMAFGSPNGDLDNVIFCYDMALKTWWTYTLDVDEPILNMIHIDHEDKREGIGIITADNIYLLPTTRLDPHTLLPNHEVLIETAELSTVQPLQSMAHLTQLEFRFDYFIGELDIDVIMVDQFGRTIHNHKKVNHSTLQHQLSEYMRIDKVVESYKIIMKGKANMRLTHFISKNYPKSNRIGSVYGFDTRQSHSSSGSIFRTFNSYNDLRNAIIP